MRSRSPSTPRPTERLRTLTLLLALGALLGSACVTRGTYDEVRNERDALAANREALQKRIAELERSSQSLEAERVRLIAESEELFERKEDLESRVSSLEERGEELSATLVATQTELEAQQQEVDRLRGTYDGLVEELEAEVAAGQIQITQLREGLQVNVADEILFAPGSAELGSEGVRVLRKVAGQLAPLEQRVEVQGHSDNIPIRGTLTRRYPSNWELAGARAARVVRLLQSSGVKGERLSAVSRAEFQPVAPNDSAESRARNRRIEIRLLPPDEALAEEPQPTPAAAPAPAP